MSEGTFGNPTIVEFKTDILIIGGGMAACGAAFEVKRWVGDDVKVTLVDKAAMDRSGAVAMGLSAINTYLGEQKPEDYCRMVSADLMGLTRDDLVYDVGRHVDGTVHLFEEWGLPIWKTKETEGVALKDGGKPVRSGKWQIMINGESYKPIVAEAAKKALGIDNIYERVFIVKLLLDANEPNRIAGAVGFSVRENKIYVFRANAVLLVAGGAVNVFRPRSTGEGMGRTWYPVWNAGSTYAMASEAGAELTMMENRFVPARFKDGYGPVGAWFLLFKSKATNGYGEDYVVKNAHMLAEFAPVRQGDGGADLPAQPRHAARDEGRPRPDPHGYADRHEEARREHDAEGDEASRSRGLGRLPRHVHRPGWRLGRLEHPSRGEPLRADADRALPAWQPLRLLRHLGVGSGRPQGAGRMAAGVITA